MTDTQPHYGIAMTSCSPAVRVGFRRTYPVTSADTFYESTEEHLVGRYDERLKTEVTTAVPATLLPGPPRRSGPPRHSGPLRRSGPAPPPFVCILRCPERHPKTTSTGGALLCRAHLFHAYSLVGCRIERDGQDGAETEQTG